MSKELAEVVDFFNLVTDKNERIELLTSFAERYRPVSEEIARRPYSDIHRVDGCESQVYVWAVQRPDHLVDFHFAVENPQGIAAMATAVILGQCLSGRPFDEILEVSPELIFSLFGRELSIAKSTGLMNVVEKVKELAQAQMPR